MVIPKINSAHGSETRNIINAAIDLINAQGKTIQDLVAEGQLTPTQYATLIQTVNSLARKDDVFSMENMGQDVKEAMTGGSVAVVGVGAVDTENIKEEAVEDKNLSKNIATTDDSNLFSEENTVDGYRLATNGDLLADNTYMISEPIKVYAGDTVTIVTSDQTAIATQCSRIGLYNNDDSFREILTDLLVQSDIASAAILDDGYIRVPSKKNGTKIAVSRLPIKSVGPYKRILNDKFTFAPQPEDVKTEHLSFESVDETKTTFIVPNKNMYNPNDPDVIKNHIMVAGASTTTLSYYDVSGFVRCKANVPISINALRNYKLYNIFKNYISGSWVQFSETGNHTITPTEDGYVRFSHSNSEPVQVEVGTQHTAYQPFGYKLRDDIQTKASSDLYQTNELYGKRILWQGDSIMAASPYPESGFPRLIGTKNFMDWVNYGAGGATIANREDSANTLVTKVAGMSDEADFIIFQGGVNDFGHRVAVGEVTSGYDDTYDEYTYAGALESIFRQAHLKWKGKKIGFIITYKSSDNPKQYNPYYQKAREACEKWSIPYIDLYKESGLCLQLPEIAGMFTTNSDIKHLNGEGYAVMYPKIESWLRTL